MNYKSVALVILLSFYSAFIHAEDKLITANASLPPEILFNGKPIDPSCFYSPFVRKDGASWEIKDKCPEPEHDGGPLMVGSIVTKPDGSVGYSRITDDGRTKEFFYKYLGAAKQGFLIQTNYTTGGTGHWGFVDLYKREANRLVFIKQLLGGDGAGDIRYENGNLYHSYLATGADLFVKYIKNGTYEEARRNGFGGGRVEKVAEILIGDGKVESIKIWNLHYLNNNSVMPECFKKTFIEAFSTKNALSENEMKEVFSKFHSLCPLKK